MFNAVRFEVTGYQLERVCLAHNLGLFQTATEMNRIELAVYNVVKWNPNLKMGIRNIYQRICDVVPVKEAESACEIQVRAGFYFGFHDKTPWSVDHRKLLGCRVLIPLRMPLPEDELEVGYFIGEQYSEFVPVARTRAWNWQQGCMLQWVGRSDRLIFNDFDGRSHVARIYATSGECVSMLPLPVGALSSDGRWALSYSFERCSIYSPGYGYPNGSDPEIQVEIPVTHGLQLTDLASGSVTRLFSVEDIASVQPDNTMKGAFHYLTHCQFSPSGTRFVFFHRWIKDLNYLRTRMISCDLEGNNLFVFPTDGMVSHVAWRDDCHVLAYSRLPGIGDRYVLFEDRISNYTVIGENCFNSDGHPSFSPDGRWMLTDTYPNRFRVCNVLLFDMTKSQSTTLASLKSPRYFAAPSFEKNWHCDLHPRWNRNATAVCFDAAHTGVRSLCTMNVKEFAGNSSSTTE